MTDWFNRFLDRHIRFLAHGKVFADPGPLVIICKSDPQFACRELVGEFTISCCSSV